MKDATAAFIILSNIIMATSSAALAIAEETVAEVTVLIQRRNANNQSNVNSPSVIQTNAGVTARCDWRNHVDVPNLS